MKVFIRWSPEHMGIPGSERADSLCSNRNTWVTLLRLRGSEPGGSRPRIGDLTPGAGRTRPAATQMAYGMHSDTRLDTRVISTSQGTYPRTSCRCVRRTATLPRITNASGTSTSPRTAHADRPGGRAILHSVGWCGSCQTASGRRSYRTLAEAAG